MTEVAELEPFAEESPRSGPCWTVAGVHASYGEFVWNTLYRMGVREPHLEDVYQEVFMVVHRRLETFAGRSAITTWLFEVCFRVASVYRRRAHFRRESLTLDAASAGQFDASASTPEREVEKRQAADSVQALLAAVHVKHRVVFVMFELEGLTCEQISAQLGVPIGTVYSRLHRARIAFKRGLERELVREERGQKAVRAAAAK